MRLGDVANVLDDIQNNKSASWYDDERSINLIGAAPAGHEHGRGRATR